MAALQTPILFKTPEGEFHLTEQGEFLSYFDAHVHLFEVFLHDKKLSKEEETFALEGIKTYMSKSVTKIDHFFEKMSDFAEYLKTDPPTLTGYLTSHFMDVLAESQKKITNQELDRLEGPDSFKSITEEILFKVGSILPKSSQFNIIDDLLVIQNKGTGQVIKPVGMLVEVKEVQERAQKEKEETERLQKEKLAQIEKKSKVESPTPSTPSTDKKNIVQSNPVFEQELSILKEILETTPPKLGGKKLEVKNETEIDENPKEEDVSHSQQSTDAGEIVTENSENVVQSEEIREDSSITDDFSAENNVDFDVESDSGEGISPASEEDFEFETATISDEEVSINSEPVSDISNFEENSTPEIEEEGIISDIDLSEEENNDPPKNILVTKPSEQKLPLPTLKETPQTKINPNSFLSFNYINYLHITRSIDKLKNDKDEYNDWISKASILIKTFISIQANISKEARGEIVNWNVYFENVSHKSGLEISILENFKSKIEILNLTKKFLDISVMELKKQPEKVQKILKSGWPHIVDTFGDAPDYEKVSENLSVILLKIKDDSIRMPIEKILNLAIKNLKQRLNN